MAEHHLKSVERISCLIAEVAASQRPYVEKCCSVCAAPCCLRVRYVYSSSDIRFLKLAGKKRKWSGSAFLKGGCWFLGPSGCTVEPVSRPLLCHTYLCNELKEMMHREDPALLPELMSKFTKISMLQRRLGCVMGNDGYGYQTLP